MMVAWSSGGGGGGGAVVAGVVVVAVCGSEHEDVGDGDGVWG